jgi:trans-aconitate 2-methyltransferase
VPWNPEEYRRFESRAAPFDDLVPLISVREGLRVVDLGCGSGELTARLAALLPGSAVLGIDSSLDMIARAARLARDGLRFEPGTIESLAGEWDLIFSHAALQWVPDHPALLPRLLARLRPGGQFVAQLASDHDLPARQLLQHVAATEPFRQALDGWKRPVHVLPLHAYAEILFRNGGRRITAFEKVYPSMLVDADALLDWYRGTALVPYLERLPETLHAPFVERFRAGLRTLWPEGPVFMPSKRLVLATTLDPALPVSFA